MSKVYNKSRKDPEPFLGREWEWDSLHKWWELRIGHLDLCILDVPNPPIGNIGRFEFSGSNDEELYSNFRKALSNIKNKLNDSDLE